MHRAYFPCVLQRVTNSLAHDSFTCPTLSKKIINCIKTVRNTYNTLITPKNIITQHSELCIDLWFHRTVNYRWPRFAAQKIVVKSGLQLQSGYASWFTAPHLQEISAHKKSTAPIQGGYTILGFPVYTSVLQILCRVTSYLWEEAHKRRHLPNN